MNHLVVMGNLGADPEVKTLDSGMKVTTLRLAARLQRGKKRDGRDEVIWWRVTLWGDQFDRMVAFLKKGSFIVVTGDLHSPRVYQDKQQQTQVAMEMTANGISFAGGGRAEGGDRAMREGTPASGSSEGDFASDLEEIPY